jgi:hypothetical protein
VPLSDEIEKAVAEIAAAHNWNKRISLIRAIPEGFGKAHHQRLYAAVAKAVYVSELAPDFAYIDWRDEYELEPIEKAYARAHALTQAFSRVSPDSLVEAIPRNHRHCGYSVCFWA